MKDLHDIASGAGIAFFGKILGAVLQYVHLVVISKILGVDLLGSVLLGMTIVNLLGILSRMGLDTGAVKFVAQYAGENDLDRAESLLLTAFAVAGISGALVSLLLGLNADFIAVFFDGKPHLNEIIRFVGMTVPFTSIMLIALAGTQAARVMKYTTYTQYGALPLLNLSLVGVFYLLGFDLNGVIWALILSTIASTALSIFYLSRFFPLRKALSFSFTGSNQELFSISIPLGLVFLLSCIVLYTDTIMLGYFKSSAEVGIYNPAMKTALLTSLIYASFNAIFTPIIAELYSKKLLERLEVLYKVVAKWIFSITLPLFFVMTLLSQEIMLIFGAEFVQGALPLVVLSFSYLVNAAVGSTGYLLAMAGRHKLVLYNTIAILALNFLLNYLMIPRYGINGAAFASCTATVAVNVLMLAEVYLLMKMHPFSMKFVRPFLIGSVLFALFLISKSWISDLHYMLRILIVSTLYLILFFGAIYRWSLSEEDQFIIDLIIEKIPWLKKNRRIGSFF